MNYINELTYANHLAQTNKLTKDKKQKNKYRQITLLADDSNTADELETMSEDTDMLKLDDIDRLIPEVVHLQEDHSNNAVVVENRRDDFDRRQSKQERGRYVESRLHKNRRYSKAIDVKV